MTRLLWLLAVGLAAIAYLLVARWASQGWPDFDDIDRWV
jgi:hypothetical protein